MEYLAKIHLKSKVHYFQLIKDRLNNDRRSVFRSTCFGPWLDISYFQNDDGMIHYLLQKQCFSEDAEFDLPLIYFVNGHSLHFGRRQFCLVTGLKFGGVSFREYRNGDIPFRNRVFPEKIGYDVKIMDLLALFEDEEKFSRLSDEDAVRVCLLLSLLVIFMGLDLVAVVEDIYLRLVNNLDAWNNFPWGEHIWRQLYDSIRNVFSKHNHQHLAVLRNNPNAVPSYSLAGFVYAFKVWILESSCVSSRWWTKTPDIIPRALSWNRKAEFTKFEYFGDLFDNGPLELWPTKAEIQSNWYTPSNEFFHCYIPRSPRASIGGPYGEYLRKRSEKRKGRIMRKEECDSVENQSLSDRVRDLEKICEGLLTLPKQVNYLKVRLFKMESFINGGLHQKVIVEADKTLKKDYQAYDEFPAQTSEDEPQIENHTSFSLMLKSSLYIN